jgi:pimeloyl-ACP methyl ester carboxylesterase
MRWLTKFSIILIIFSAACDKQKNTNMETTEVTTNSISKDVVTGLAPVNGIKMYYEIHGSGKPLVLVHGGGSTMNTTFGYILPMLAKQYKVVAVDLQNHGKSGHRSIPETFDQDAEDIIALLQYLKIDKAHFFGFSNGGNTIMKVALKNPEMVDRLVIASAFYKREGMIPGFFEGMPHATLDHMPGPLKSAFIEINKDEKALQNMFEKDKNRMVDFQDWNDEDLEAIKAPALLILGDKDVVVPQHAVQMAQLIPGARLMILPADHGSYIGEICTLKTGSKMPEFTVEAVKEFLNGK